MQKESEEEAHAAKEAVRIIVLALELLAVEVVEVCMHVLERNILRTDFPALLVRDVAKRIIRRSERDVLTDMTVSGVSAPSAGILVLCALVVNLDVARLIEGN